jgi:hypothetical protein
LAAYHTAHGRFPDRLDELVTAGLIDGIPEVPELGGSRWRGLSYEVSPPVDLYRLHFSYDIPQGPYGPGTFVGFTYLSDKHKWVQQYGSSLWEEASNRLAKRWREKRDADSLSTFVRVVMTKPKRESVHESQVKEWLGDGQEGSVPPPIPGAGVPCTIYRVAGIGKGYGFTYRLYAEDGFGGKQDYKLMDRIYEITGSGRDESWQIVLDRE